LARRHHNTLAGIIVLLAVIVMHHRQLTGARRRKRSLIFLVVAMGASVGTWVPAAAQTVDVITSGYMRLYAGKPEEAQTHFDQLHGRDAQALAPWFGSLFVQMARLEDDESLAPAFEKGIDAFIERASARHDRSREDTEALFYLAQAYLLRSTYRLDHDKGMWGAARDAAKSKGYSDAYIKRHPEHGDAYLSLGLITTTSTSPPTSSRCCASSSFCRRAAAPRG
jgi:hypothetical protein